MNACLSKKITLFLLLAGLLQAACRKEEAGPAEVSPEQEQKRQSVFLTREDSLRWIGHLRSNPEDTARAFIMLGVLYLANDYPEVTVRYLELADDYDPGRPVTYLNLGDAYNRIGMKLGEAGKKDSMEIMCAKAAEAFKWYVQRVPRSAVTEEIYRIVEKYRSMESEKDIPR
ncbi:MAG: hypothetical protein JXQ83_14925 [Candidatus Glassbacteria bacterium]|nr:hypothetical protein [Candidatus Glassbacteria bacterium]